MSPHLRDDERLSMFKATFERKPPGSSTLEPCLHIQWLSPLENGAVGTSKTVIHSQQQKQEEVWTVGSPSLRLTQPKPTWEDEPGTKEMWLFSLLSLFSATTHGKIRMSTPVW